jgi:hypothetical protein
MRCNSAELTGRFQPESSVLFVSCSAGIEPSLIQQVSVACGAYCAFFSNLRGQFVAGVLEGKKLFLSCNHFPPCDLILYAVHLICPPFSFSQGAF